LQIGKNYGRDLLLTITLRVCQVTGIKGASSEVVMQQRKMSTTYWLLAAKEMRFSIVVFQLSDGHMDGDISCACVTTGPVHNPLL